ncbi:alpha/beta hydrolase family esterase [Amnibacterium setariae]|uniref:Phospholipase/carboxylesterase/thioesterase domain-containing protein n=1 Tax=Amnibacterium setariae TaxID=2306585 RepID=A0A3A1U4S9_9MICO|nr:hypothetical protein [Amnibacterium setariae]RIX30457.1 hypothetical protein D1781_03240 [Amnibacterium setariae]
MSRISRETVVVGDRRRTLLRVRPSAPSPAAPLLLGLHGTGQTGAAFRRFGGRTLDALAERTGADLVLLDGHRRAWNDARRRRTSAAQRQDVDDVGFVRQVARAAGRPVLAIGYSNGGQLLHRVLREEHGLLAGAVLVAAGLPVDEDFTLVGVEPDRVPMLLLHGTADPIVPFDGGTTRVLGRSKGVVRSAAATAAAYAPEDPPAVTHDGAIERRDWGVVRLVVQEGVGHVVPNRRTSPLPFVVGPSHHDLDLGEEVQDFFAAQPDPLLSPRAGAAGAAGSRSARG